jgi:hypothetical protein
VASPIISVFVYQNSAMSPSQYCVNEPPVFSIPKFMRVGVDGVELVLLRALFHAPEAESTWMRRAVVVVPRPMMNTHSLTTAVPVVAIAPDVWVRCSQAVTFRLIAKYEVALVLARLQHV